MISICLVSFNATIKIIKYSSIVLFEETVNDDLLEEDDFIEKETIVSTFYYLKKHTISLNSKKPKAYFFPIKSIILNIDSPPPKAYIVY